MTRIRKSVCTAIAGLALGLFSFLIVKPPQTAGQQSFPQPNRKPACTCFCGDATFNSFRIFSAADVDAGKCYGGPLPADACGQAVNELPAAERAAVCQRLKASASANCPAVKAACGGTAGDGPKPDCQKPTPWFDPQPDCKDVQAPVVAINNRAVTVSVCGYPIFRGTQPPPYDPLAIDAYKNVMEGNVQSAMGSKVCCDKLRDAARTGNPCFPAVDIDCDGKPNDRDTFREGSSEYPDINLFTRSSNQNIDRFPPGLDPDDPNFMPWSTARDSKGVGDCPCKWELTSGKLTCSPDGRADHVYAATWTCPANGKEVLTTKYVKATGPCKEYKDTSRRIISFDEVYARAIDPLGFISTAILGGGCDRSQR